MLTVIALALTSVGIYGVVAYITRTKLRDFGIRAALGAAASDLFLLVTRQGLLPVAIGTLSGFAGAYFVSKTLAGILYKTSPYDGILYAGASVFLLAVAFAACVGPALRASRTDPAKVMRAE